MSHDHHHPRPASAVELRARALEAVLAEKGLVSTDAIDAVVELYERDVGPQNGAKVVARAWVDDGYRERLLSDSNHAIAELGFGGAEGDNMVVVANAPGIHNMVVCTLCSCYPWPVLGLPPTWYRARRTGRVPYRSRAPCCSEFGVELGDEVEIRVWDSSAEVRYLVLPMRPERHRGLERGRAGSDRHPRLHDRHRAADRAGVCGRMNVDALAAWT